MVPSTEISPDAERVVNAPVLAVTAPIGQLFSDPPVKTLLDKEVLIAIFGGLSAVKLRPLDMSTGSSKVAEFTTAFRLEDVIWLPSE
jgi:hypothetical protein